MEEISEAFICPLTLSLLEDPVILGLTGHTFERLAITQWLQDHNTNPLTGQILNSNRTLAVNVSLADEINSFVAKAAGKNIPQSELLGKERLGAGSNKVVYRGLWNSKGKSIEVAILRMQISGLTMPEAQLFVRLGSHPNLVRFFGRTRVSAEGVPEDGEPNSLVTELGPLGNLSQFLGNIAASEDPSKMLSISHKLLIAEQVADGMSFVHAHDVVHRDIAARNVLVFSMDPDDILRTCVKLSDSGLSLILKDHDYLNTAGGTSVPIRWMSPEAIQRRQWSKQSDVWAFGVMFWELLSDGLFPYGEVGDDMEVANGIMDGSLSLHCPDGCPDDVWELVMRCLTRARDSRPMFSDVKIELQRLRAKQSISFQCLPFAKSTNVENVKEDVSQWEADQKASLLSMSQLQAEVAQFQNKTLLEDLSKEKVRKIAERSVVVRRA